MCNQQVTCSQVCTSGLKHIGHTAGKIPGIDSERLKCRDLDNAKRMLKTVQRAVKYQMGVYRSRSVLQLAVNQTASDNTCSIATDKVDH